MGGRAHIPRWTGLAFAGLFVLIAGCGGTNLDVNPPYFYPCYTKNYETVPVPDFSDAGPDSLNAACANACTGKGYYPVNPLPLPDGGGLVCECYQIDDCPY